MKSKTVVGKRRSARIENLKVAQPPRAQCPATVAPTSYPVDVEWLVDSILGQKIRRGKVYYLLKWTGWGEKYNSWEPEENLIGCSELLKDFHKLKQKNGVGKRTGKPGGTKRKR